MKPNNKSHLSPSTPNEKITLTGLTPKQADIAMATEKPQNPRGKWAQTTAPVQPLASTPLEPNPPTNGGEHWATPEPTAPTAPKPKLTKLAIAQPLDEPANTTTTIATEQLTPPPTMGDGDQVILVPKL